jgi:hypothetical protein
VRFRKSIRGEDDVVVGEANPEGRLEIGRGVFKRGVKPAMGARQHCRAGRGSAPATGDNVLITDRPLQPARPGRLAFEHGRR